MSTTADSRNTPIPLEDPLSAIEYCYEAGWTDGLPVVPPTTDLVDKMLTDNDYNPTEPVGEHLTTKRTCTAHAAAANSVMAGCLPEHFPVVVAALRAMSKPGFNYHGSTASTGGAAHMVVVSGPITEQLEMNASGNLFGSGNRANACLLYTSPSPRDRG